MEKTQQHKLSLYFLLATALLIFSCGANATWNSHGDRQATDGWDFSLYSDKMKKRVKKFDFKYLNKDRDWMKGDMRKYHKYVFHNYRHWKYKKYHHKPKVVPLPAAAWFFVSALAGLLGISARKKRKMTA